MLDLLHTPIKWGLPLIVLLVMTSGAVGTGSIMSCAQCTSINEGARWCPDDMTCYQEASCSCSSGTCFKFPDCFVQDTTCRACIESGGLFCEGSRGNNHVCTFPNASISGVRCISSVTECAKEPIDSPLSRWLAACGTLTVTMTLLLFGTVYRAAR
ncbi:hypothetical protein TRVL_01694 [Trypanosoma vivax]|uniref:Uncharacterized protein n=1 Tax=Trypanosoma vivax (strain Y486) TaxID=1055687 RepID=G0TYW9_TRYVY|nr:hypothetical protein TRVL_01694 [Trypanosoma vivax]CCC49172.1 conserved hypothetical protein [Trypanosoma vivax Y486]